jgi:hypothetical protein
MEFIPILFKGAIIFVSSDFVKIDDSYVRANAIVAQEIAEVNYSVLPTPEIVDEIYAQSTCPVTSPALDPANEESYAVHEAAINKNIAKCTDKTLIAGHKKTIVRSNRDDRLAIYGWFDRNGRVIQPYSTVHDIYYADYSHGIRLVRKLGLLNGKVISVDELLSN